MIAVSVDKDYSDWIQYMSNVTNALTLFSGFTFTSITILLTLLPDPSRISSQITLFLLSALLDFFLFFMGWQTLLLIYYCKNIPPLVARLRLSSRLWFSSFGFFVYGSGCDVSSLGFNISCLGIWACVSGAP